MGVENLPTIDDGIDNIARKFFGSTWDENYGGAIGGTSISPDMTGGAPYSAATAGGGGGRGMDGVYDDYGNLMREEFRNDELMGWQGGAGGGGVLNTGADGFISNGRPPMNMQQYPSQQQHQQQYQQQQYQQQYQQQQQQEAPLAPLLYTPSDR